MPDAAIIQKFYAVESIHRWNALKMQDGSDLTVDTKAIGFIPVYDDIDKAKKDWPGSDIHTMVVSFKPKANA